MKEVDQARTNKKQNVVMIETDVHTSHTHHSHTHASNFSGLLTSIMLFFWEKIRGKQILVTIARSDANHAQ